MLAMPWPTSSTLGLCLVAAHAVGNDGGHQRFNRAEHGHGDGRRNQRAQQIQAKLRNLDSRKAGRNAAEARADGFAPAASAKPRAAVPANSATMYPGTRFT